MPIENPRSNTPEGFTIVNPPKDIGNFFIDLPYRTYSSNRLDGNSDGAAEDFDGLYGTFSDRMGRTPNQEWIVGSGNVGGRKATVALFHRKTAEGMITERAIQISFAQDPGTIYYFGDGAHILTVDSGAVLKEEVKRDQEARQLMKQLLKQQR